MRPSPPSCPSLERTRACRQVTAGGGPSFGLPRSVGSGVNVCCRTTWLQPAFGTVNGGCAQVGPWNTVIVALVNATSVIVAVQLLFGQPPCLPVIGPGSCVLTLNVMFPFFTSLAGIG